MLYGWLNNEYWNNAIWCLLYLSYRNK
jgi:hypothetical protein